MKILILLKIVDDKSKAIYKVSIMFNFLKIMIKNLKRK